MTKKGAKTKDGYLRREYGITLGEYGLMLAAQDGGCAICGSKPDIAKGQLSLAVDHNHKIVQLKIIAKKVDGLWTAHEPFFQLTSCHDKRRSAVKAIKHMLRRQSVRGLLCWPCNSGLRKWNDRQPTLQRAATYLLRHEVLYDYVRVGNILERRSHAGK